MIEVRPDGTVKALFSFQKQPGAGLSASGNRRATKRPQRWDLRNVPHIRWPRGRGSTRAHWVIFTAVRHHPGAVVLGLLGTTMGVALEGGRG